MLPPVVGELKFTAVVGAPLHTTWLAIEVTVAVGFTVIVKLAGVPVHETPPLVNVGITVTVDTTGPFVLLVPLKVLMSPVPLPESPVARLLLVQLYTMLPPVVGEVKVTEVGSPLQMV